MQAVIMAGGKGTRLASVTQNIPKPMVSLMGKPLLEHQLKNLKESGITDIIMVVGYLGEVIQEYFGDGSHFGVTISYFVEEVPLGTAGALKLLDNKLEDTFVLVFGDLFINVDFVRFWAYHMDKQAMITLFAHPNSHPFDSDILVADQNGCVAEWIYKNTERLRDYQNLVNAGLYIVSKAALKYLPDTQKIDLEKQLITSLIPEQGIYAYHSTEYVKDIGTPERLHKAEQDVKNGICEKRNLKNKQKCIFLDRDGTINRYVGFLRDVSQMELEQSAAEAIRLINESEYLAIVITNQPVIARGECTYEMLGQIHNRMETLLGAEGAYIDSLYYCPHHPDKGYKGEVAELKIDCNCRKPKTGMIVRAVKEHNIDLTNSWMVGDSGIDVQMGINTGVKTALVMTGEQEKFKKYQVAPDVSGKDLLECVKAILTQ